MIHRLKLGFTFISLLAATALAQDIEPGEEQPEIRRYTVEMIVFAYDDSVSAGTEIFLPDEPPQFAAGDDWFLFNGESVLGEPEIPEIELLVRERSADLQSGDARLAFAMLDEEQLELTQVRANLEELEAYIPLMHFGWTQPTYPQEETKNRPLAYFAKPPEGLKGDIALYLSRYLHLAINLEMDATTLAKLGNAESFADAADSAQPVASNRAPGQYRFGDGIGDIAYGDTSGDDLISMPTRYRINEDRIFKNGELRYFDHPRFGVLAKVTRVEEPDPEDIGGELLGFDGE